MTWICPDCTVTNTARAHLCENCGIPRVLAPPAPHHSGTCPLDGSQLRADGWCLTGDGFPLGLPHPPDACPSCRKPLRWDGDCPNCLPPGAKPGHLYDYDPYDRTNPKSAHWRVIQPGPQPIVGPTPEQKRTLNAFFAKSFAPPPRL